MAVIQMYPEVTLDYVIKNWDFSVAFRITCLVFSQFLLIFHQQFDPRKQMAHYQICFNLLFYFLDGLRQSDRLIKAWL